jgi:hypothetical protein
MSLKDFLDSEDKAAAQFLKTTDQYLDAHDALVDSFQESAGDFLDGQVARSQAFVSELLKTTKLDAVEIFSTEDGSKVSTVVLYFPLED